MIDNECLLIFVFASCFVTSTYGLKGRKVMSRILKRCIFNVFNFYKPQKRYESATMEDAILNTHICFVIKCHIPIRCIPPQKELNQVKNEIFSHLQFF